MRGNIGLSGVRALPLAAGINVVAIVLGIIGPSGVRALPLAAGINVGGHYTWHYFSFFLLLLPRSLLFYQKGLS